MASANTLRQRIKEELRDEIARLARAQLATAGAGALSPESPADYPSSLFKAPKQGHQSLKLVSC